MTQRGWTRNVIAGTAGVAVLALASWFMAATPAGAAKRPKGAYKVDIITSVTGVDDQDGVAGLGGASSLFDYINASGGINGHRIRYKVIDDQSSSGAASAVQAVGAKPTFILDASNTTLYSERLPTYEQAKLPVIASVVPVNPLEPYLYSGSTTAPESASLFAKGAAAALGGSLKGKNVAMEAIATPGGVACANNEKPLIANLGGTFGDVETLPLGGTSFGSGAANIVASNPNAVLSCDTTQDSIVVAKALQAAGYKGPIIGSPTAVDKLTLSTINDANFHPISYVGAVQPGSLAYKEAHKYGQTTSLSNFYWAFAWGAAYAGIAALQKCGYPCPASKFDASMQSLGSFNVPGLALYGNWKVTKTDHNFTHFARLLQFNPATKKISPYGPPLPVGPPDYPTAG